MSCCNHCLDAGKMLFDRKTADRDLKRYKRKGPDKSTRMLLEAIRKSDPKDLTLLDIGGGIGTISFELLKDGLWTSTEVEASPGYLEVLRQEAENRGLSDRIRLLYGDFTDFAPAITPADIVTLDRVVCCYPDMEKLIDTSVSKARKIYGLVYPRKRVMTRLVMSLGNLWFKFRSSDFRVYLHLPDRINRQILSHGFTRVSVSHTFIWEISVYKASK